MFLIVIPAKAGIHRQHEAWIPAFAGMTVGWDVAIRKVEASAWRSSCSLRNRERTAS